MLKSSFVPLMPGEELTFFTVFFMLRNIKVLFKKKKKKKHNILDAVLSCNSYLTLLNSIKIVPWESINELY